MHIHHHWSAMFHLWPLHRNLVLFASSPTISNHTFDPCQPSLHTKTLCVYLWLAFAALSDTCKIITQIQSDWPGYMHPRTTSRNLYYHDWVTLLGIVVIASQYWSMNGMMSMSLLNICLVLPSFADVCCKLAMAVVHIWEIAENTRSTTWISEIYINSIRTTYWLVSSGNFPIQSASNFCKRKCNWWRMESTFPIGSRCKIRETIDCMSHKAARGCSYCDLCHCKKRKPKPEAVWLQFAHFSGKYFSYAFPTYQ